MTDPTSTDDNKLIAERRAKLAKLREAGNAFPNDFRRTAMAGDLQMQFGAETKEALAEQNQVVGVDYPGQPPRYEWADGKDKVHFACRSCDKLFALEDTTEDIPPANAPKGFEVQGFEVMLYGTCPKCT